MPRNKDKAREMGLAGYAKVKRKYEAKMVKRILDEIHVEILQEKGVMTDERIKTEYEDVEYRFRDTTTSLTQKSSVPDVIVCALSLLR